MKIKSNHRVTVAQRNAEVLLWLCAYVVAFPQPCRECAMKG